jgi:hypothetical protein
MTPRAVAVFGSAMLWLGAASGIGHAAARRARSRHAHQRPLPENILEPVTTFS